MSGLRIIAISLILTFPLLAREYITGPKGGCYYINSSGKKVYVDHKYCK